MSERQLGMDGSPKLGPRGYLTVKDQIALYAEVVGEEKAAEQVRLARLEAGKCICTPRSAKRRWEGNDKATARTIHEAGCPKWKGWMGDDEG